MSQQPRGQAEWIRRVLDDHEAPLLRYALRLTGNREHARDVVQETFLRLCRTPRDTIDGHVGPWLFRVCRQRALDTQRKEQRMGTAVSLNSNAQHSPAPGPAEQVEQTEHGQDVLRLLTTLSENQQEVVRLKFQSGLKYREISEVTGLSVSNVGFLLHTALAQLRGQLLGGQPRRNEPHGGRPENNQRPIVFKRRKHDNAFARQSGRKERAMTLRSDDPRLTAYALGELDEKEIAQLEAELGESPEGQRALAEIRQAAELVRSALAAELVSEPLPKFELGRDARAQITAAAAVAGINSNGGADTAHKPIGLRPVSPAGAPALGTAALLRGNCCR